MADSEARRASKAQYYQEHREEILANQRERQRLRIGSFNRENMRAHNRKYYAAHPEMMREKRLKKTFGITLEEYEAMYVQQAGLCAICGFPPKPGKFLDVDHDHKTGQVRGLLCRHCNVGIGYLRDNPQILSQAIAYLERDK